MRSIIHSAIALAVLAGALIVGVKLQWPEPAREVYVPVGKIINGNSGLDGLTLTNTCIVIRRPTAGVIIQNCTLYISNTCAIWSDDTLLHDITIKNNTIFGMGGETIAIYAEEIPPPQ